MDHVALTTPLVTYTMNSELSYTLYNMAPRWQRVGSWTYRPELARLQIICDAELGNAPETIRARLEVRGPRVLSDGREGRQTGTDVYRWTFDSSTGELSASYCQRKIAYAEWLFLIKPDVDRFRARVIRTTNPAEEN